MCFGKSGGIIDHAEEQHRRAVHDFRALLRDGLHERVIEQLPLRYIHSCRRVPVLADHAFQQDVFEQAVHLGVDVMRIPVGFLPEFFRAFLDGTHVLLEFG